MLYLRCPTCKTILANKQLVHEERLPQICDNSKLSEKEKNEAKMKLLDDLEVRRVCCRMRIMSYVKLIDEIK
jgi:DNA-directed RNA polymerase subunit N (RpoN/RPB10)